jgi:hypothetical protein
MIYYLNAIIIYENCALCSEHNQALTQLATIGQFKVLSSVG